MADDVNQPDPISWLMIEAGWRVVASDGEKVGDVSLVAGDSTEDVFDGLAVSASAFGQPKYVPAEQIARVSEGVVQLAIDSGAFEALGIYEEPASSGEIEPSDQHGFRETVSADVRQVEQKMSGGIDHEHKMSIWRRIGLFFKRR